MPDSVSDQSAFSFEHKIQHLKQTFCLTPTGPLMEARASGSEKKSPAGDPRVHWGYCKPLQKSTQCRNRTTVRKPVVHFFSIP